MEWLTDPEIYASFFTLAALEIVLGIDNVIFISLVANKLPEHQQRPARMIGLAGALVLRVALLFSIVWIVGLTETVFSVFGQDFSWRDLILIGGGLFLLYKGTTEIHDTVEGDEEAVGAKAVQMGFAVAIAQIMVLDAIFSLDSVITAVGMTDVIGVMIAAVSLAILVMVLASESLSRFIHEHPTAKMLALSFLLLVGVALIADGLGFHIPRGYLYFAIAFSALVEALNLMAKRNRQKSGKARRFRIKPPINPDTQA